MNDQSVFKKCSMCAKIWLTRQDFFNDNDIELIGYQADFDSLENGLLFFNHNQPNCGTTLSFPVKQFHDLYNGPVYTTRATGNAECPGYCLHKDNLDPCPAKCECAYVRQVIQVVRNGCNKT